MKPVIKGKPEPLIYEQALEEAKAPLMSEPRLVFKRRRTVRNIGPDAPEGGWGAIIPKGSGKIIDRNGDPGINFEVQLITAHEKANVSSQNNSLRQRITFYDPVAEPQRKGAANQQFRFVKALCIALDADFERVYPKEIASSDDLLPLVTAIENKPFTMWTTHRLTEYNGEAMINVDIRFTKPDAQGPATPQQAERNRLRASSASKRR